MTETRDPVDLAARTTPTPLHFDSDAGSSRSKWIAWGLVLLLGGWMGSGFVLPTPEEEDSAPPVIRAVSVAVQASLAQPVTQFFVAEGQALPDRETVIRSETSGQIAEVLVKKGADVKAGQVFARFDPAERTAARTRAEEELNRARRDAENAETLLARGASTADRVAQTRATLAAAEEAFAAALAAMDETELRAPFDGRLEQLSIDPGEFVQAGADVAHIVDNTPLSVSVQVPQQALRQLEVGQMASVRFITGEERMGSVAFLGTSADAATRTFLTEITVPNLDGAIPAGVSAEVRVPTGTAMAHFLSPAILSLDTDGTLGVKTVDDGNRVVFTAIEIVRAQTDGIWVSGLPDEVQIITIGQGFVNDGEVVDPRPGLADQETALRRAASRFAGLDQ
ncbi:MAG: efflux RND transporter periplasmic adaptor subunit [Pseudomonadota bacterium]